MKTKMKTTSAVGFFGNGLVTITLNGEHEMTTIKIKPECVDPEDIEGLEDLIKAAYNDGCKKIQDENLFLICQVFPGMPFSGLVYKNSYKF